MLVQGLGPSTPCVQGSLGMSKFARGAVSHPRKGGDLELPWSRGERPLGSWGSTSPTQALQQAVLPKTKMHYHPSRWNLTSALWAQRTHLSTALSASEDAPCSRLGRPGEDGVAHTCVGIILRVGDICSTRSLPWVAKVRGASSLFNLIPLYPRRFPHLYQINAI